MKKLLGIYLVEALIAVVVGVILLCVGLAGYRDYRLRGGNCDDARTINEIITLHDGIAIVKLDDGRAATMRVGRQMIMTGNKVCPALLNR